MGNQNYNDRLNTPYSANNAAIILNAFCKNLPENAGDALPLMNIWKMEKRTPIILFKLYRYMSEKKIYSLEYLADNWSKYSRSFSAWSRHSGFSTYGRYDEKFIIKILDESIITSERV
jgi:hypothetical protein